MKTLPNSSMDKRQLFEGMEQHLMEDDRPSDFFQSLDDPVFLKEYPFTMLVRMKVTEQSPIHHPEGSVWNHTMLVLDEAAKRKEKSSNPRVFMWAALLHDIGKPDTTRKQKGRITAYDHDKVGARLTDEFMREYSDDGAFIQKVVALVRWHMQILYVVKSLPFADIKHMKQETNYEDIALIGLCDRLGRLGAEQKKEENDIMAFLQITKKVQI